MINRKQQTQYKEGNVFYNNALNPFYLWLYGKRPLSKRGNLIVPDGATLFESRNCCVAKLGKCMADAMRLITILIVFRNISSASLKGVHLLKV